MGASHFAARHPRIFGPLRHPVQAAEAELHHLHEVEAAGESGETPFIALAQVILLLIPAFAIIAGAAFAAYYLS